MCNSLTNIDPEEFPAREEVPEFEEGPDQLDLFDDLKPKQKKINFRE